LRRTVLYAAFDVFPSSKGAATHISHMFEAMQDVFSEAEIFTLGSEESRLNDWHTVCETNELNYLRRSEAFTSRLTAFINGRKHLQLFHYRDIWSGLALIKSKKNISSIFEVNGLPSIELPYRYTHLGPKTLNKIRQLENTCLQQATQIVTPSQVTAEYLTSDREVAPDKIVIIPNGAVIAVPKSIPFGLPKKYLIYFGALQPWQGLDVLVKALGYLKDLEDLKLVIAASNPEKQARPFQKLISRLNLEHQVIWKFQLPKDELNNWIQNASISVAPLKECSRNVIQGCSPLKIIESMAAGTPVIASDLAPVREIVQDKINGRLVRPDRPADLARMIRVMIDFPANATKIGQAGKVHIEKYYQLKIQKRKLKQLYNKLTTTDKPAFYRWIA